MIVIPLIVLLSLGGLMHAVLQFEGHASAELAFGFLLLTSYFSGVVASAAAMPRLTGYILAGVVVGPSLLGLIDRDASADLSMVGDVATALIALHGGAELDLRMIRLLRGTIRAIVLWAVVGAMILLTGAILAARPLIPFLDALPFPHAAAVCGVLGVTLAAQSPAVVMALIGETRADGVLTRTILAVVVIADLVVVVAFGVAASIASAVVIGHADVVGTASEIAWEVLGSIGIGLVIGAGVGSYLRNVRAGIGLFTLLICFIVAQVSPVLHLDALVIMISAGIWIQNVSRSAHELVANFDMASLPVYLVFFALAGAKVDLAVLAALGAPIAVIVIVRAGAFVIGCRIAMRDPRTPPALRRFGWLGLLPQAGLALAIAELVRAEFPAFGDEAFALVVGVVGANQLLAPVLLRVALVRSGEAGKRAHPS